MHEQELAQLCAPIKSLYETEQDGSVKSGIKSNFKYDHRSCSTLWLLNVDILPNTCTKSQGLLSLPKCLQSKQKNDPMFVATRFKI